MIYCICGELVLLKKFEGFCLAYVKCKSGVGFELKVSHNTANEIEGKKEVNLFSSLVVKENSMELFGFFSSEEKEVFRLLVSVSGVGPSFAIFILSFLTVFEFYEAINSADYEKLCGCKGIGKKTANRIILELKDKVKNLELDQVGNFKVRELSSNFSNAFNEAVEALVVLGYGKNEAKNAVAAQKNINEVEELVKKALVMLNKWFNFNINFKEALNFWTKIKV